MPAQLGNGIVLVYAGQGERQLGSAVLLETISVVQSNTRVAAGLRARWGDARPSASALTAVMEPSQDSVLGVHTPWGTAVAHDGTDSAAWGVASAHDQGMHAPWLRFTSVAHVERLAEWFIARATDDASHAPWGRYEGVLQPESVSAWTFARPRDEAARAPWGGPMVRTELQFDALFAPSAPIDMTQWVPWSKFSRTLNPTIGATIPPDDGVPTALIVVPVRKVYMQINASSLRRVSDNVGLPALSLSLALDMASWVWTFSASLPADAAVYVEPVDGEPVELEATVNGEQFRVFVERIARERSFGRATISISGRGKLALLDAPYAPEMSFSNLADRTVQQIIGDVLSVNGVPMGYTVNFGMTDWLVPSGVFAHKGSYISAVNRIAAAGGGYVQPHPTLDELFVLPKYPFAPWDWTTDVDPDYELPSAAVTRESIEWVDKPRYNRVFVSGQQAGIVGNVLRAGTAGDLVAPMVVDALITHADAARQRGIPVLSDVGRIANVSLRLPVLDETGVIVPGKFVRYVDGATTRIGIVRAVSLDVGLPQVWQTIKLETHHEPV